MRAADFFGHAAIGTLAEALAAEIQHAYMYDSPLGARWRVVVAAPSRSEELLRSAFRLPDDLEPDERAYVSSALRVGEEETHKNFRISAVAFDATECARKIAVLGTNATQSSACLRAVFLAPARTWNCEVSLPTVGLACREWAAVALEIKAESVRVRLSELGVWPTADDMPEFSAFVSEALRLFGNNRGVAHAAFSAAWIVFSGACEHESDAPLRAPLRLDNAAPSLIIHAPRDQEIAEAGCWAIFFGAGGHSRSLEGKEPPATGFELFV
jgi:hypothetical protein